MSVESIMESGTVTATASSFVEYAAGGRRRRTEIVTAAHEREDEPEHYGRVFYVPILRAIRAAARSDDPAAVLAEATAAAELNGQPRAFAEVSDGFLAWWRGARRTAVHCRSTVVRVGELNVAVAPHLAVRDRAGETHTVLFHLKEAPLTRDAANAALRLMAVCAGDLLPGAHPLVVDLRRAREYRLPRNTNTTTLDAWLTAEASAYTTHWHTTAP
ncbi:hypothetical protein V5P93_000259 [Actinokineospora auranticolor]|uniref:Uncharacterized protein n=1 Tax=Actinokineospora auranticolor TaxID=155976 RepID=A0A2S6GL22_9PSEU|nr:hypothetical protein [Actinokineospora auranticolor]PPK65851.1 hypothetical protein CLV40_112113 [Actinokineospora auranticolor]